MIKPVTHQSDWLSLISVTAAAVVVSIHHFYRLGPEVLVPAVIITALPYLLQRHYRASRSRVALWGYTALVASIFLWFGFVDGFLDHVLKALGLQHTTLLPGGEATVVPTAFHLWSPAAGNLFYEGTGILEFALSVAAVYLCFRFLRAQRTPLAIRTDQAAPSTESI